jgi:hypothetical protein
MLGRFGFQTGHMLLRGFVGKISLEKGGVNRAQRGCLLRKMAVQHRSNEYVRVVISRSGISRPYAFSLTRGLRGFEPER